MTESEEAVSGTEDSQGFCLRSNRVKESTTTLEKRSNNGLLVMGAFDTLRDLLNSLPSNVLKP